MRGATVAILPESFEPQQLDLSNKETASTKPLLPTQTRWSKKVLGFFVFVALGAIILTTEMQIIPGWGSLDSTCSPVTVNVAAVNYRSNDRFYTVLKEMRALSPPTFREKHLELCDDEHVEMRKSQYCLPITSQRNRDFCTSVDRMELLIRQSLLTLCRSSVMHLLSMDVYEELDAAGASPRINFTTNGTATTGSITGSAPIDVATIMYSGIISRNDKLHVALYNKGYHLFQDDGEWRVCVAPTHPLASRLYDSDRALVDDASSVPHITLVIASSEHESSEVIPERIKAKSEQNISCSPVVLNAKYIEYHSSHRFYSMLQTMEALPPPTFQADHKVLCDESDVDEEKLPYCLPISARSDAEFCAGADRIDLLVRQSPSTICLESVLHLLVADIFDELQAAGGSPVAHLHGEDQVSFNNTNITYSTLPVDRNQLKQLLLQKGYHLFGKDTWRVCVAPVHPLAATLYDSHQAASKEYMGPHIKLIPKDDVSNLSSEIDALTSISESQEIKNVSTIDNLNVGESTMLQIAASDLPVTGCTPDSLKGIDDGSSGEFYSILESTDSLPPPRFEGEHEVLCSSDNRKQRGYSYCLPISGQKDTLRCANADRMDILLRQSPKKQCFSSVLHLLLKDVVEELKAVKFAPILTFGTLLGAVRDGGIIPFTEDVDIAYNGKIVDGGELDQRLWRKGYHLFQYNIFRVCVAPTHPLASQLYDSDHPIVEEYLVPYVDLYSMEQEFDSDWSMQELRRGPLPNERVQPFSQVAINGEQFDTVHDPGFLLLSEYGADYMTPKPRQRRLLEFK